MKRRITIAVLSAAMCVFVAPVAFNSVRYKINPIAAAFIPWMDGTEWSPNYSYRKFRQIKIGMTTNDVLSILGPCLGTTQFGDLTQWHYTRGKDGGFMSSSSYSTHFRIVSFNPDGKVAGKTYDYYFD